MHRAVMLFIALTFSPAVVAAQQPCTPDATRVVNELYRQILERGTDPGSSYWVQQLQQGRTVREVVQQFAKSDEHLQRFWRQQSGEEAPYIRAVAAMYRHLVGREPDAATARSWANSASQGAVPIIDYIVGSSEYDQRFGDWGVPGSTVRYCGRTNQGAGAPSAAVDQPRFRGMDRNNDGVITRSEWRGSRQSFEIQDWDNDGVLSGDEIDGGAGRFEQDAANRSTRRSPRFETLDTNGNGRIERREWDGTPATFTRLDANRDNVLSRIEMVDTGVAETPNAVATSGELIRVNGRTRWTDTAINVVAGDVLVFDSDGTIRVAGGRNDVASVSGVANARRSPDAPFPNQSLGALIARIGNSGPLLVGNRRGMVAPTSGRLYLGVNDDYLEDNSGDFQVIVTIER